MQNEWKQIETVKDIPEPGTWDKYEWRGDIYMISTNEIFTPDYMMMDSNGVIKFRNHDTNYINVRYRPKPFPTDEYIKAHLWYGGNFSKLTFQEAVISADSEIYIWGVTYSREWFKTASHIPKSAIKTGISE